MSGAADILPTIRGHAERRWLKRDDEFERENDADSAGSSGVSL